jgi:hypothetical protein
MKKFGLLLISALVAFCISAQEVQNVSHGTVYLKNKASDNWFMGLAGGIDTYNTFVAFLFQKTANSFIGFSYFLDRSIAMYCVLPFGG